MAAARNDRPLCHAPATRTARPPSQRGLTNTYASARSPARGCVDTYAHRRAARNIDKHDTKVDHERSALPSAQSRNNPSISFSFVFLPYFCRARALVLSAIIIVARRLLGRARFYPLSRSCRPPLSPVLKIRP